MGKILGRFLAAIRNGLVGFRRFVARRRRCADTDPEAGHVKVVVLSS